MLFKEGGIILKWIKDKWNKLLNKWSKRKKRNQQKTLSSARRSVRRDDINFINIDNGTNVLDVDLIDDNLNNKDKKKLRQYTKIIISIILSTGIMWITWSYVLATIALLKFESFQPLESLSAKVCAVVISSIVSYALKSFAETFCEKKNEIDIMKFGNENKNSEYDDFIPGTVTQLGNNNLETDDDSVG